MASVLLFAILASTVVFVVEIIAAFVFTIADNLVAQKVFQALDYTMTVAGFVVASLWIASLIFGI